MLLTAQIAIGIWMGGLFLIGTVAAYFGVVTKIERNRRYGAPWWKLRRA